jgi:hypothetical protein
MSANPIFHANPFLGQWLSASQSMTQAWLGSAAQQQIAMLADMNRQALRFWTLGWLPAGALRTAEAATPRSEPAPTLAADAPEADAQAVELEPMAAQVPLSAAPAAEPLMPMDVAPAMPVEAAAPEREPEQAAPRPAKRGKAPAPLRTAAQPRKAAVMKRKPGALRSPRVTRH